MEAPFAFSYALIGDHSFLPSFGAAFLFAVFAVFHALLNPHRSAKFLV